LRNRSLLLSLLTLISLVFALPALSSARAIDAVQQDIDIFKRTGDHIFSPQTMRRAEQYLGAARLAAEQGKDDDIQAALTIADEKLAEAKRTASDVHAQYQELLDLRSDAQESVGMIAAQGQAETSDYSISQRLLDKADESFNQAIQTRERGNLNQTQQLFDTAQKSYTEALSASLPRLSEMAASEIGEAGSDGARKYAPVTYQTAKDKLAEIRAYIDGIITTPPHRPGEALQLGHEAKYLTENIKIMRKDYGSHEELVLKSKDFNRRMATVLGLETGSNALLSTVSNRELLSAVEQLKQDIAAQQLAHQQQIEDLKALHQVELQSRLTAQTDELRQAQQSQLADMKEAFRAKLERETYEKKRQEKLLALFNKGEADILINLDGSLLVRLVSLQFESSKSKIDPQYFEMLSRLKAALDLYGERNVRIEGHTDDQGEVKPNQVLSLKRAEAVREYLIAASVDGARLKALGYGEVRPIASNAFPQGRAMNRRIDIVINAAAQ